MNPKENVNGELMNLKWENNSLIRNYCLGFSRVNLWKVQNLGYSKEDLFQECFIVYERCMRKFKGKDNALFFSLLRKSLSNMLFTLAKKSSKEGELFLQYSWDLENLKNENTLDLEKEAYFLLRMEEAPKEVKNCIKRFSSSSKIKKLGEVGRKTKEYIRSASE